MTSFVTDEEVTAMYNELRDAKYLIKSAKYHHVDTIDGIAVDIVLKHDLEELELYFTIKIEHFQSHRNDDNILYRSANVKKDEDPLTENDVRLLLLDIEKSADLLKWNKRVGRFLTHKRPRENENHIMGSDCCVCLEKTKTTTLCDHTLCVECLQKLGKRPMCPLCREQVCLEW